MALPDLTGQNIQDTYKRVLQVHSDGQMYDGTGSIFIPLSASHEVNIEVSSSYAQTASFIANGIHSLTSAEVNQLKNISSSTISENQWSYVGSMNQDVSMTSPVQFSRLTIGDLHPTSAPLLLPTEASITSPHIMTRNTEDIGPSLFLGDRSDTGDLGTKIISFVNQNEDEVAHIKQDGTMTAVAFSGTVSTATTATNFDPAQDQTLNNNIDILGKETGGTSRHMLSMSPSNIVRVGAVATPLSLRSSGAIHITGSFIGNITASGNISSSGNIIAGKIEADQLISHTGDANTGLQFAADTVDIESNDFVVGKFSSKLIQLNRPVTASGNISASGTITANFPDKNDDNLYYPLVIDSLGSHIESQNSLKVNPGTNEVEVGSLKTSLSITASGDISSSGEIIGTINGGTF